MGWTLQQCAALCIVVFTCTVISQDPIVSITLTEPTSIDNSLIEASRDSDVIMDCYVENLPVDTLVRWQKVSNNNNGGENTQKISENTAIEDNTKHSIEKPTQFTWRLRIKAIQVSDEANYTCYVQITLQNRVLANRTVRVLVPPFLDLEKTSPDLNVREGESVDLLCNATGRPAPRITWTRLGGALLPIGKERHLGSQLSLVNIQARDRGKYRCVVENRIGRVQRDIELTVRFKPIINPVTEVVYQKPGCRIELQCLVASNPFPSSEGKSWIKGSTGYSISTSRYDVRSVQGAFNQLTYEMIIYEIEQEDYGIYSCQMKNLLGTSRATVELKKSDVAYPSVKLGRVICGGKTIGSGVRDTRADILPIVLTGLTALLLLQI